MRRNDIQGLRALAVLAVVAYHAGLPMHGGFVGVDVFFVISGYVITNMLRREREASGRVAFASFYLRRFKRLAPALSVVVAFTVVASSLLLSPLGPQEDVARTAVGALFFFANWSIATRTGGYFDRPADSNPLLHTWSLSVEEQFYLVFPAILALAWMSRKRFTPALTVGAVTVLSFALVLVGGGSWLAGFYSPLTRGWEFGIGSLLALATARRGIRSQRLATFISATGLELLLLSQLFIVSGMHYPGPWTVLPVASAALLLVGGTNESSVLTRLLGARPLAGLGDRSYSLYLWHWPFIVAAAAMWPGVPHVRLYAAAASVVPALLSFAVVEQPLRRMRVQPARRLALLAAAVVTLPFAVDAAMASTMNGVWSPGFGVPGMHASYVQPIGQKSFYRSLAAVDVPCASGSLRAHALYASGVVECAQSSTSTVPTMALVGDSHSEHLYYGLHRLLPKQNIVFDTVHALPTVDNADIARVVGYVREHPAIHVVVLNAFWHQWGLTSAAQLVPTLRALRAPGRRIFITDDLPFFPFDAFSCKYRRSVVQGSVCSEPVRTFRAAYDVYAGAIRTAAAEVPGVHVIHTAHLLCTSRACSMVKDGRLLYRDSHHLNVTGSRVVAAAMLRDPVFATATADPRLPLH